MIDAKQFVGMTGRAPEGDELERANCDVAGTPGHLACGICPECNKPRFVCGHFSNVDTIKVPRKILDEPHRA